jgi:hypothetical protein
MNGFEIVKAKYEQEKLELEKKIEAINLKLEVLADLEAVQPVDEVAVEEQPAPEEVVAPFQEPQHFE